MEEDEETQENKPTKEPAPPPSTPKPEGEKLPAASPSSSSGSEALAEALKALSSRSGGLDAAGLLLMQQRDEARRDLAEARQELASVRGQLPADGETALTQGEVDRYEQYKTLGSPDTVKTKLATLAQYEELGSPEELQAASNTHSQVAQELATLKAHEVAREAAELLEWESDALIPLLAQVEGHTVSIEENDRGERVPTITPIPKEGEDGEEAEGVPLADFAATQWKPFLSSLVVGNDRTQTRKQFPPQVAGAAQPKPKSYASRVIQSNYGPKKE